MCSMRICVLMAAVLIGLVGVLLRTGPHVPLGCRFLGQACPDGKALVRGSVAPGYESVRQAFEELYTDGHEIGSQFVVYRNGEKVVDLNGGVMREDTLAVVFSSGKVVESLVAAMLVDRGLLEYDAPIAKYWPEFAQNGKEKITVRQLMSHAAELPILDIDIDVLMWKSPGPATDAILERQKPLDSLVGPDTAERLSAYHGVTRGLFLDKLVRIVDGRTITKFVEEEIAKKAGDNVEFHFSTEQSNGDRVVQHVGLPVWAALLQFFPQILAPNWRHLFYDEFVQLRGDEIKAFQRILFDGESTAAKMLRVKKGADISLTTSHDAANDKDYREAVLSSSSGVSNARSMAKIASLLANGGSPFLSDDGLKKAMEFAEYYDVLLGMRFNFTASGWGIDRIRTERLDNLVGWFGAGGSAFQFSPKHNLAFAYVPAFLTPRLTKPRVYKLLNAVEKVMFD